MLILLLPITKYALTLEPIGQDLAKRVAACCAANVGTASVAEQGKAGRTQQQVLPGRLVNFGARFFLFAITTALAVAIPQFDKLLGFAGSLFSYTTCLVPVNMLIARVYDPILRG